MKNIFTTLLISAAGLAFATASSAASNEAKATYKSAKDKASNEYKMAHQKCDAMSGNSKEVCVEEAKSVRIHTDVEAEAQYKNTAKARINARIDMAKADYSVAKAKCGSKTGNDKDVCIKEAKAVEAAAIADAKADKKVGEARMDARDDKRDAEYKVAMEKCDALAGSVKDACIASAKVKFGK